MQKGSNVDATQLTFDFNFNRAVTYLELQQIEELINFYIRQGEFILLSFPLSEKYESKFIFLV